MNYVEVILSYASGDETPKVSVTCKINKGCFEDLKSSLGEEVLQLYRQAGLSLICPGGKHCRLALEEPLDDQTRLDKNPTSLIERTKKYRKQEPPNY